MKLVDWLLLSTSKMSSAEVAVKKKSCWSGREVEAHLPCPDSIGRIHPRMLTTVHYPTRSWWNHVKWCVDLNLQQICMWNIQKKTAVKCESSIWNHVQLSNHTTPITRKLTERSCSQLNRGSMEPSINLRRTVGELEMTNRKMNTSNLAWHICIQFYWYSRYVVDIDRYSNFDIITSPSNWNLETAYGKN